MRRSQGKHYATTTVHATTVYATGVDHRAASARHHHRVCHPASVRMGKASVSRGKKKDGSVRKSHPRPCRDRKTVEGGLVCHEHGGKWLRTAGTTAAGTRREVYSCGAAGCTSEVSKCQHCGLLHSGRKDNDYLENLDKCRYTCRSPRRSRPVALAFLASFTFTPCTVALPLRPTAS